MSTSAVQSAEGVVLTTLVVGLVLRWVILRLGRSRPGFAIGRATAVGFTIRLGAIAGISATGLDAALRGGDENTFLAYARNLAEQPLGHGYFPHGPYQLHTVLFALQLKLGFMNVTALRITQVGLAMLGVVLILAAVNDLSSAPAARLGAWLLAFEPTSIFFNSALHKEPLMELAAGLVVFGGTRFWRKLDIRGVPLMALGGLIAVWTRSYAGWFLVSSAVLILLHGSLRRLDRPGRAMPVIYAVVIAAFLVTPTLLQVSSAKSLKYLQQSQNANVSGAGESSGSSGGSNGDNLALEQVNFSTRGALLTNLPQRMRDLIFRPYPWQLGDTSQRIGALGTLIAYAILLLLVRYAWLSRGRVLPSIGPVFYPMFFMLIAYSLSAGNAGTGFRYRSHLVTLGVAAMVILRQRAVEARPRDPGRADDDAAAATRDHRTPVISPA